MTSISCHVLDLLEKPIAGLRVTLECFGPTPTVFDGCTSSRGTVDCWFSSASLSSSQVAVDSSAYSIGRMSFHIGELFQNQFSSWPLVQTELRLQYDCHQLVTLRHGPYSYNVQSSFIPRMDCSKLFHTEGPAVMTSWGICSDDIALDQGDLGPMNFKANKKDVFLPTLRQIPSFERLDDDVDWDSWLNSTSCSSPQDSIDAEDELQTWSEGTCAKAEIPPNVSIKRLARPDSQRLQHGEGGVGAKNLRRIVAFKDFRPKDDAMSRKRRRRGSQWSAHHQ
ncbi:uncharacterized protein B0I36DRAFT_320672 [Microdochium trichocladiopsis]|uniref:Transthyretin/hydroxyisourate hydrolase domain-containing protein n=1 Tax=Microdochium trichocladiopsis TaxID=1682393 RepID=A0A9P8Y995_9PEZI|nr:uncharacterized protein B0I36DRAFT_320672 [Microdochium trichocladiopsis]KAH7033051.1 hypothetical protein B0I36DRAFT_320672 [Microdochium trichocladiopsis]